MITDEEFAQRVSAARSAIGKHDLSALLLFAQESLYYLFGYDGGGYVFFQCAILTADAEPVTLLCRRPDVAQARDTSSIDDVRVWYDAPEANPAHTLATLLREKGLDGQRIGIETDCYGLTGFNHQRVRDALGDSVTLVEASHVVRGLRLRKSEAEISLVRRAAALADDAVDAVANTAEAGALDATLAAAALTAMLSGGGDVPPAGPLVNSGARAVYGRGVGGPRPLGDQDLVLIELAGTYRRYNACIERTLVIGQPTAAQRDLHRIVRDTLRAMIEAFRPGEPLGHVDDIHRRMLDEAGLSHARFAACGYSLGATYRPSWMDVPPMIYSGNALVLEPGMVFFPHVMVGDRDTRLAMGLGDTVLVSAHGPVSLSRLELDLLQI